MAQNEHAVFGGLQLLLQFFEFVAVLFLLGKAFLPVFFFVLDGVLQEGDLVAQVDALGFQQFDLLLLELQFVVELFVVGGVGFAEGGGKLLFPVQNLGVVFFAFNHQLGFEFLVVFIELVQLVAQGFDFGF